MKISYFFLVALFVLLIGVGSGVAQENETDRLELEAFATELLFLF